MGMIKPVSKTRDLTLLKLFEVLQEEYIVCELRVKIYPHQKHRDYWSDTMRKKKEKITDIAKKNGLFSIFDNIKIKENFEHRIIPEFGYPKFIYRDTRQQLMQEKWDLHNYYLPDTQVKIIGERGETLIGIIFCVDFNKREIKIRLNNEKGLETFDIDLVTRILT